MKVPFVDLKRQYAAIQTEMNAAIQQVITETAFIGGKYCTQFEQQFAPFCNAKHCVGVGNGTDALFIVLKALGIGAGDEVLTVANSFIASSEAITAAGAKVVFVDCHPVQYTIDVTKIAEKITPKTRAIIPVHLYGQPADMAAIQALAQQYHLAVIEDAAQAHGARLQQQRVGAFGNAACFSFYPGKNLGAYGDAGAIVTNDEALATKCRMLANHGRLEKYRHLMEGYNSRLDGLQAAILSVKLKYLEQWNQARRRIADFYLATLNASHLILPEVRADVEHVYHLFVVQVEERQALIAYLKQNGIETGIHYPIPLPAQEAYRHTGWQPGDFPIAEGLANNILSLPMFPELTEPELNHVATTILNFYR
ncbi:DegT/DnrJ/EryC1/StrS family aminotransferase [candidate division KSB1 bacterium]|nr:DegT/DnrJ/EryC1/StrS family aminotransferase [candidate division KSB1 bacterium]